MKSPSHLKVLWFLSLGTDWRLRSWPAEAAFSKLLMQELVIIKFRTTSNHCLESLISPMCTEGEPACPLKGLADSSPALNPGHCFNLTQLCESIIRSGLRCWQRRCASKIRLTFTLSPWNTSFLRLLQHPDIETYGVILLHCLLHIILRSYYLEILVENEAKL